MCMNIKIIFFLMIATILVSCGYKKISQNNSSIYFQNVNISGEKRFSYKLKNNMLLLSNKTSEKKYDVEMNITNKRSIKIKDKAGKATRYTLLYTVAVIFKNIDNQKPPKKLFTANTDYDVAKIHSDTINNEKSSTQRIIKQLSSDIENFISLSFEY